MELSKEDLATMIYRIEVALDRGCYNTEEHRDALIKEVRQLRRLEEASINESS